MTYQPNLSEKEKAHLSFHGWILQLWFWMKGIVLVITLVQKN